MWLCYGTLSRQDELSKLTQEANEKSEALSFLLFRLSRFMAERTLYGSSLAPHEPAAGFDVFGVRLLMFGFVL